MTNAGNSWLGGLENDVLAEIRAKSQKAIYLSDPEAWLWDVLGYRWHAKQREIGDAFLNNRRIAIKSSNGAGKSRQVGELITWGVSVHEPGELLAICSAPTMRQIEQTTFAYLAANYSRMKARKYAPIGRLTSSMWTYQEDSRSRAKSLVLGQKPSDQDIIGSFQGIRAIGDDGEGKASKTWVLLDEGGSVPADLFVAAEAVTTGAADNKILTIGNPDSTGTYFQKIFEDPRISQDWSTNTISAFDLPTFTGETVYPNDPKMQEAMLSSGMIDRAWVEQKERAWGKESARYLSKVLGQFPDGDDWSFFPQSVINKADEAEIEEDELGARTLGVDLADGGPDDSKAYLNVNGRVRHRRTWNEGNESVGQIHEQAVATDASVVVIDRIGVGAGPYNVLAARVDRYYTLVGAKASEKSPDPSQWANARAYWYDMLREGMKKGEVDLDFYDEDDKGNEIGRLLKEQLESIIYGFNNKGAILIESKKDMRKRGVKSPDDLDAVIFAYAVNAQVIAEDPLAGREGDIALEDPYDEFESMAGFPI